MRIPIKVEYFAGGVRPMISCSLKSENPYIFGFINAIIDTGSPTTILGWGDVVKMRISQIQMQKLEGAEKLVNLGGAQIRTRILPEAIISKGKEINVKIPIQVPVKLTSGTPPPTILGVDFLLESKLSLYFNPIKKEGYLETQEE